MSETDTARSAVFDVYSARELALAAGVPVHLVRERIRAGDIPTIDGEFVAHPEAVAAVHMLSGGVPPPGTAGHGRTSAAALDRNPALFQDRSPDSRGIRLPVFFSTVVHGLAVTGVLMMTILAAAPIPVEREPTPPLKPLRLVYLMAPGPGGGGGGGGLKRPTPPPRAERKRPPKRLSSPVPPVRRPRPIVAARRVEPPTPPPLRHEPAPLLLAPVVPVASGLRDRVGTLESTVARADSPGPGEGGGVGGGGGVGLGSGHGSGIGPGSGGGTGGGPYRPGSGVEPPRLLHEVKPSYSEDARRRGIEGSVVLEIVVRDDGRVGDLRVIQRLGYGLDDRAMEAVWQWRFTPAIRVGQPVDVIVEVAVEFLLR